MAEKATVFTLKIKADDFKTQLKDLQKSNSDTYSQMAQATVSAKAALEALTKIEKERDNALVKSLAIKKDTNLDNDVKKKQLKEIGLAEEDITKILNGKIQVKTKINNLYADEVALAKTNLSANNKEINALKSTISYNKLVTEAIEDKIRAEKEAIALQKKMGISESMVFSTQKPASTSLVSNFNSKQDSQKLVDASVKYNEKLIAEEKQKAIEIYKTVSALNEQKRKEYSDDYDAAVKYNNKLIAESVKANEKLIADEERKAKEISDLRNASEEREAKRRTEVSNQRRAFLNSQNSSEVASTNKHYQELQRINDLYNNGIITAAERTAARREIASNRAIENARQRAVEEERINTETLQNEERVNRDRLRFQETYLNSAEQNAQNAAQTRERNARRELDSLLNNEIISHQEHAQALLRIDENRRRSLVEERRQQERNTQSIREQYEATYVNTAAQNRYNQSIQRLNSMLSSRAISQAEYDQALAREAAIRDRTTESTDRQTRSTESLANATIRYLRWAGTIAGVVYAANRAWDATIRKGIEVNKMMEDNTSGFAALISKNTQMVLSNGEVVNSYEKFVKATQISKETLIDIKEAAVDTFATFPQLTQLVQQAIGHTLGMGDGFGETTEEIIQNTIGFTQSISNIAGSIGMDMVKAQEETRSLISGNASTDSLLAILLFGSPTEANKAIKDAKTRGANGVSDMLKSVMAAFEPLKDVESYTKNLLELENQYSDLTTSMAEPMFADFKDIFKELTGYIKENKDEIVEWTHLFYDGIKTVGSELSRVVVPAAAVATAVLSISAATKLLTAAMSVNPLFLLATATATIAYNFDDISDGLEKVAIGYKKLFDIELSASNQEMINKDIELIRKKYQEEIAGIKTLDQYSQANLDLISQKDKMSRDEWEAKKKMLQDYYNKEKELIVETSALKDGDPQTGTSVDTAGIAKRIQKYSTKDILGSLDIEKEKNKEDIAAVTKLIEEYQAALDGFEKREDKNTPTNQVAIRDLEAKLKVQIASKEKLETTVALGIEEGITKEKEKQAAATMRELKAAFKLKSLQDENLNLLKEYVTEGKKEEEYTSKKLDALQKERDFLKAQYDNKSRQNLSEIDQAKIKNEWLEKEKQIEEEIIKVIERKSTADQKQAKKTLKADVKTIERDADANKDGILTQEEFEDTKTKLLALQELASFKILTPEAQDEFKAGLKDTIEDLQDTIEPFTIDVRVNGFDDTTESIAGILNGFADIGDAQVDYYERINKIESTTKDGEEAAKDLAQASISGYSDMSSALGGFYDEDDKRKKEQEKVTKALNAVKMVMHTAEMAQQLMATTVFVTQEGIKAQAAGATAAAVAAQSSPWTGLATMAAMIASLASIGIMLSGSGGNKNTHETIENPNTTTVFGGGSDESESLANSLGILEDYAKPQFRELSLMADYLENIDKNISGVASDLIRTGEFALGVGGVNSESYYKNDILSSSATSSVANAALGGAAAYAGAGYALEGAMAGSIYGLGAIAIDEIFDLGIADTITNGVNKVFGAVGLGGGGYNWQKLAGSGISFGKSEAVGGQSYTAYGSYYGDIKSQQSTESQTLSEFIDDFEGLLFQTQAFEKMKKSTFGSASYTYWSTTEYQSMETELENSLTRTFSNIRDSIVLSSSMLGEDVGTELDNMAVDIGSLDLMGLEGDEVIEKLNQEFSAQSDKFVDELYTSTQYLNKETGELLDSIPTSLMTGVESILGDTPYTQGLETMLKSTFGGLAYIVNDTLYEAINYNPLYDFQDIGEGLYETLIRVSTGVSEAGFYIDRLGANFDQIDFEDIIDKQGDVGFEALSQSITEADEATYGLNNGVVQMIHTMNTSAEELFETYGLFETVRGIMDSTGSSASDFSSYMLLGAGGMDEFSDAMESYLGNFFSEEEQLAHLKKEMNKDFEVLNLTMPKTIDGFKDLVSGIDTTTIQGQELYGRVILLADGFTEIGEAAEASNDNIKSFTDSFKTDFQLAEDMAASLGVTVATSFEEMNEQFIDMSSDIDGLTDAELDFLNTTYSLTDSLKDAAAEMRTYITDYDLAMNLIGASTEEANDLRMENINNQIAALRGKDIVTSVTENEDTVIAGRTFSDIMNDILDVQIAAVRDIDPDSMNANAWEADRENIVEFWRGLRDDAGMLAAQNNELVNAGQAAISYQDIINADTNQIANWISTVSTTHLAALDAADTTVDGFVEGFTSAFNNINFTEIADETIEGGFTENTAQVLAGVTNIVEARNMVESMFNEFGEESEAYKAAKKLADLFLEQAQLQYDIDNPSDSSGDADTTAEITALTNEQILAQKQYADGLLDTTTAIDFATSLIDGFNGEIPTTAQGIIDLREEFLNTDFAIDTFEQTIITFAETALDAADSLSDARDIIESDINSRYADLISNAESLISIGDSLRDFQDDVNEVKIALSDVNSDNISQYYSEQQALISEKYETENETLQSQLEKLQEIQDFVDDMRIEQLVESYKTDELRNMFYEDKTTDNARNYLDSYRDTAESMEDFKYEQGKTLAVLEDLGGEESVTLQDVEQSIADLEDMEEKELSALKTSILVLSSDLITSNNIAKEENKQNILALGTEITHYLGEESPMATWFATLTGAVNDLDFSAFTQAQAVEDAKNSVNTTYSSGGTTYSSRAAAQTNADNINAANAENLAEFNSRMNEAAEASGAKFAGGSPLPPVFVSSSSFSSFAVGTPKVPHDMTANIHKNEMIVPATFNQGIQRGDISIGNNKDIITELQSIREENMQIKNFMIKLAANSTKQLNTQRATLNSSMKIEEQIA